MTFAEQFLEQHGLRMRVRYKGLQLSPIKRKVWRVVLQAVQWHPISLKPRCYACREEDDRTQATLSLNFCDHEPTADDLFLHLCNLLVMSHPEDHDEASGIAKRARRFFTQREIDELTRVTFFEEPTNAHQR